jgi:xanthine/uracil permease
LVICGMIATAGLRLLSSGKKDETYRLTTAISLSAALTLPLVATAQKDWFATLPPIAKLFLGNGVVLAITLAIAGNAILGAALRNGQEAGDEGPIRQDRPLA